MKRFQRAFLVAAGLTLSALASAGPNAPTPLADVSAGGCSITQIAPFGTSLRASWDWANGDLQTKFGGDAKFNVMATTDGGITTFPLEVEFELEQYVPGTLADAYPGQLVYRCSTAVTNDAGTCNGSVLGLRAAIAAAVEDQAPGATVVSATLDGVYVKAMNPGHGGGRQNYPLVNVCDVVAI